MRLALSPVLLLSLVATSAYCAYTKAGEYSLGIIECDSCFYDVLIDKKEFMGKLFGIPIYRVAGVSFRNLGVLDIAAAPRQRANSPARLTYVQSFLAAAGFYYGRPRAKAKGSYKLWRSLEWNKAHGDADEEWLDYFLANEHMHQAYCHWPPDRKPRSKLVRAIRGHVAMNCFPKSGIVKEGGDGMVCIALISRISSRHTGTRLITRGATPKGDASNTVEIETIVSDGGRRADAFVQMRGSIPFLWAQTPTWTHYMQPTELRGTVAQRNDAFRNHIELLLRMYKGMNISLLSLVEGGTNTSSPHEARLANEYQRVFDEVAGKTHKNISYVPFQLNSRINELGDGDGKSRAKWHVLLMADIGADRFRFAEVAADGSLAALQNWLLRTSCLSSLDRSSVVQRHVSDLIVLAMLQHLLGKAAVAELSLEMKQWMGERWLEIADGVSKQYSGTIAKKGDLIRIGKNTFWGRMVDVFWVSPQRHLHSNLWDSDKFETMKVVFGRNATWTVNELPAAA